MPRATRSRTVRTGILDQLRKDYPTIEVRDQEAYAAVAREPVNGVLVAVGFLLAMAILIALLGIVNTLALGVVERTREIGLLRAIGMDRPQLSRMLRVESIAITLLGAFLGLAIGVAFAVAVQSAMVDDGLARPRHPGAAAGDRGRARDRVRRTGRGLAVTPRSPTRRTASDRFRVIRR